MHIDPPLVTSIICYSSLRETILQCSFNDSGQSEDVAPLLGVLCLSRVPPQTVNNINIHLYRLPKTQEFQVDNQSLRVKKTICK